MAKYICLLGTTVLVFGLPREPIHRTRGFAVAIVHCSGCVMRKSGENISERITHWAACKQIRMNDIPPRKPQQNAYGERFN